MLLDFSSRQYFFQLIDLIASAAFESGPAVFSGIHLTTPFSIIRFCKASSCRP